MSIGTGDCTTVRSLKRVPVETKASSTMASSLAAAVVAALAAAARAGASGMMSVSSREAAARLGRCCFFMLGRNDGQQNNAQVAHRNKWPSAVGRGLRLGSERAR